MSNGNTQMENEVVLLKSITGLTMVRTVLSGDIAIIE